jgi:Tfp pilus assembly protein PilF
MSKIQQIELLLATQPNDNFLQHALGLEYIKLGNDEKAKTIFCNLLKNDESYVGSYYHLAKLYERNNEEASAVTTYEKGMQIALAQNEKHAYGELRSALEELTM